MNNYNKNKIQSNYKGNSKRREQTITLIEILLICPICPYSIQSSAVVTRGEKNLLNTQEVTDLNSAVKYIIYYRCQQSLGSAMMVEPIREDILFYLHLHSARN